MDMKKSAPDIPNSPPIGSDRCHDRAASRSLIVLLLGFTVMDVAGQQVCNNLRVRQATDAYDIGHFSTTFRLLRPCLPDGFADSTQRVEAYRLMALSYLATDSLEQAQASIRFLLRYDGKFRPDAQQVPPLFVNMVDGMKPKWYTWPWKGNEWYKWAGRGLIVGSAIALPILFKKEVLPVLPEPPAAPGSN